ncbi:MAG: hypothetical protein DRP20_04625 [Thermotogae bacterium]|nr:MAG: hypothetical protein DRP20_04625 [Thermotogota bacterium]
MKVTIKLKKIIKSRGITNGKVGCHEKKWASQIPMVVPQVLAKSDIVKIIEQLDKLLPSNFVSKQGDGFRPERDISIFSQTTALCLMS